MSTLPPAYTAGAAAAEAGPPDGRSPFNLLAEATRCLADAPELEAALAAGAGLALPHLGTWCMVDVVEGDDTIRRVAVVHPDPAKQRLARSFYEAYPPRRDDPLGAPRAIRAGTPEPVAANGEVLDGIAEAEHRRLLAEVGAQAFLVVPMAARGRTLGAVTFVSDTPRRYDAADLLLAGDLGRRFAMAVDNARLHALSQSAGAAADDARAAASAMARRAEELLAEANRARHDAEKADRTRITFLNTISHEFRTPLTAVQGFSDVLASELAGPLTEAQRHQLGRIRAASDHLLGLIDEILTFAAQNAGRADLDFREADLREVVRDAASLVAPLAAAKGLHYEVRLPPAPVPGWSDAGKLRQIVLNLGANAVKFTPAGQVRVEMECDGGALVLRVADTGMGIAPEDAERVFDPFWQADQANTRPGGTGLGLSVTRQLAALLGGEVALESAPGRGSVFTVRLPLRTSPPEGPAGIRRDKRVRGRRGLPRRGRPAV